MKRKSLLMVVLALTLGLLAFPLLSCGEVSFTTARLSEMTMAASIDETTAQPIEKTDTFSVDTPQIFVSVKVSNAPSETDVTTEWIYVGGEVADLENYTIDTASVEVEGTRYIYFYRPMPEAGWPKGDYKVVFSIDDKEQGSVPFKVQ
jgi:hypothetical protein